MKYRVAKYRDYPEYYALERFEWIAWPFWRTWSFVHFYRSMAEAEANARLSAMPKATVLKEFDA